MDIRFGRTYPLGDLSNLATHHFTFRHIPCKSMEGLLQGLKFEDPDTQKQICTLAGYEAKRSGKYEKWYDTQTLWWQGCPIKRESEKYQQLLDEAYDSLFDQNETARKALLDTNTKLTHVMGYSKKNETILTQQEFCSRLMKIRDRIKAEQFVTF